MQPQYQEIFLEALSAAIKTIKGYMISTKRRMCCFTRKDTPYLKRHGKRPDARFTAIIRDRIGENLHKDATTSQGINEE